MRPAMMPPARLLHQLLGGPQALSGGDHVVQNGHPLAPDLVRVGGVDDQGLLALGGDGLHLHLKDALHVGLGLLAGEEVLLRAALPRHLIEQGDGLRLGGDQVIIVGGALQKLRRAVDGEFHISEDHEGADGQIVGDRAQRQVAFQTGDVYLIRHGEFLLNKNCFF